MSADLSDPNIVAKYQEIISFTSPTNWCVFFPSGDASLIHPHSLSTPRLLLSYGQVSFLGHNAPFWVLSTTRDQSRDKLSLYASGDGGIQELQQQLHGDVFFVFLREDRSFILISFVPEDISGVRRGSDIIIFSLAYSRDTHDYCLSARALVHSRAVGSLFKVNFRQATTICITI